MRPLLCSALALLAIATVCNAACYFKEVAHTDSNPPKGCQDEDGKMHEFGSSWVKDCMDCSCSKEAMSCCDKIPSSVDLPPECEMIVDKEKCTAKIVLKADKTKECVPV
ncbi:beta-microseminoprotein-like [Anguilla anguilla]|uniref:beta-microseminoprotein-like n=1 Tax=Anguilla anguilla TaxID=7936 RepID=UPI0015AD75DA|nr:beta-microseminoprotein-like [Anguilla anguilla]